MRSIHVGIQGSSGFLSLKFPSPGGALCLSTRFSVAAGFTVDNFFKVNCDIHAVLLGTAYLFRLFANQVCYAAVFYSGISCSFVALCSTFAAVALILVYFCSDCVAVF